ncbi:MAG: chorismate synthase, partial [Myxococcales bacterium]|nr:chorismate synthase [Myxococcales bacterium]
MNTLGRLFRVSIFGESHGPCVGVLIDGCPAGLELSVEAFEADLVRRRPGALGTTTRRELDKVRISSGVFEGRTT